MIGFETFLLMNDNSTDDTQCILDAYAGEGIVIRMPEDTDSARYNLTKNSDVFDACTKYIKDHPIHYDPSRTWMMTHDTDEFVWFNRTDRVASLGDAMSNLIEESGGFVKSLLVPRLLVGPSGQDNYDSGIVIDRFIRRFNLGSCPNRKVSNHPLFSILSARHRNGGRQGDFRDESHQYGRGQRRRLFDPYNPVSYCNENERRTSYDLGKSISHVSSIATHCTEVHKTTGQIEQKPCTTTHHHTLQDSKRVNKNAFVPQQVSSRRSRAIDKRYLPKELVGRSIEIMHYMTKSREEFYERVCASVWGGKYSRCPNCSPETYFNLTRTYADNFEDKRMAPFSAQLRRILELSTVGTSCNTQPMHHPLDYYQECLRHEQ